MSVNHVVNTCRCFWGFKRKYFPVYFDFYQEIVYIHLAQGFKMSEKGRLQSSLFAGMNLGPSNVGGKSKATKTNAAFLSDQNETKSKLNEGCTSSEGKRSTEHKYVLLPLGKR